MGYKARWGPMGFLVSPSKIVPFDNFSTSVTLNTDKGEDTSGKEATNTKGLALQPMSFSTKYMRVLGVDPRERYEAWSALVGQSNTLYIGEKRFGPAKMQLTAINVSELLLDNNGNFLSITLDITLQEDATDSTTAAKTTSTSSASASTAGSSSGQTDAQKKAAAKYQETVEQRKAMNATASSSDRNAKK